LLKFLERNKKLFVYTPLASYWFVLLAATSFPTEHIPSITLGDKMIHLFAYFGLGILVNLTLLFQNKYPLLKRNSYLFTIIIGSVYAVLDELHQLLIPGRFCEVTDMIADITGLVVAVICVYLIVKISNFIPQENTA
jgi:VanZ family protein